MTKPKKKTCYELIVNIEENESRNLCAIGYNNVVITGIEGFTMIASPQGAE
jgi:hypothetical protein